MKTFLLLIHRISVLHLLTLHLPFLTIQFRLQLSQFPHYPPIPLSLNNTLPTQSLPQNPPPSSTHDPSLFNQNPFSSSLPPISSISQTTSSTTQPTSYNPYISLHPTFQNFPTNSFQPPPTPPHPTLPTLTLHFKYSSLFISSFSNRSFCPFCCSFRSH